MKILRVFPRRTSQSPEDGIFDPPGLFREPADEVHISVTFTWDIPLAEKLRDAWADFYPVVRLGGPAFGDPGGEFEPGRYVGTGVVFTSRGCPRRCQFCLVPEREGPLRELEVKQGWIVQDNNLLSCSDAHLDKVFRMLSKNRHGAILAGGLDCRLISDKVVERLRGIRIQDMFLAFDSWENRKPFVRAMKKLKCFPRKNKRVFVMIGQDGIEKDTERLVYAYMNGAIPYPQLYQPSDRWIDYPEEYRDLARTWSRPAIVYGMMGMKGWTEK